MDNNTIRRNNRQLRNNMSLSEQRHLSSLIVENISKSTQFKKCKNIAVFLPNDSEPDLSALIEHAWAKGLNCYLPILGKKFESKLKFQLYSPSSPLILNCYNIPEPKLNLSTCITKPWLLDLILMPLVAFDLTGNRIGMGGGYYDKTLHYRRHRSVWQKPPLMGVAYAKQQVVKIKSEKWDIPLDFIASDNEIKSFKR